MVLLVEWSGIAPGNVHKHLTDAMEMIRQELSTTFIQKNEKLEVICKLNTLLRRSKLPDSFLKITLIKLLHSEN